MKQSVVQVDTFTSVPFAGNPAAVCLLTEPQDDHWLQNVAREMNLSETAFLLPQQDGYNLRWFTPAVEVKLCGHATLASAHVLWETGHLASTQEARFHTLSGLLTANRYDSWIEMNFPATVEHEATPPPSLLAALHVEATYVGRNQFDYLVEVPSEEIIRSMQPDLTLLSTIETRGVVVTSRASSTDYDFVSRFFAPQVGVPEDPVTGSAHCCLAPYWASRLGKEEMQAFQASARGGVVRVRVAGNRVNLSGQAVTIMRGELLA
jgi:predicted PhzF superfamily epimerase YddE/YHI9